MTENLLKKDIAKDIVRQYLKASVHFGHAPKEWNPKMAPYILYEKHGYHILDVVKTAKLLKLAGKVLEKKVKRGQKVLFVGTTKLVSPIIAKHAIRSNSFYINYRWLGGMLTNWSTIQKRIERLKYLEQAESQGNFENLSKKEYSQQRKELDKLKRLFNGIKNMTSLPDIVIFSNQLKDSLAIQECLRLGIPVIGIVDSNCDPDLIPYPIPANDDSSASLSFILNYLATKIIESTS
jgi:small subunit ribosomal protein S2